MSTIGSNLPANVVVPSSEPVPAAATPQAAKPQAATSAQSYKPQWLVPTVSGSSNFDMLGLPSPRASGDLAALIAQVSLNLETTVDDGRKQGAVAKLAGLASALAQFDNTALKADLDKKQASEKRTGATNTDLDAKATALAAERAAAGSPEAKASVDLKIQDARVASAGNEIADLKADLAAELALVPTSGSTPKALQDRIDALRGQITGKEAAKAAITADRDAAKGRIDTLTTQIADLRQKLAAENGTTDESRARIATLNAQIGGKQADLAKAYSDLGAAASSGLASDQAALAALLTTKTAERAAAGDALNLASLVAVTMAMVLSSAYRTSLAAEETETAGRDVGIDTAFQAIAAELNEASARLGAGQARSADENEAFTETEVQRAETVALGILRALADVSAALADLGSVAAPGGTAPAAGRVRIGA